MFLGTAVRVAEANGPASEGKPCYRDVERRSHRVGSPRTMTDASDQYWVYILTNRGKTVLYVGVTNDLRRRLGEHQRGNAEGFP